MFSVVTTFVFVVLSLFTVYKSFAEAKTNDFIIALIQALWSFYYFGYSITIVRSGHYVAQQVSHISFFFYFKNEIIFFFFKIIFNRANVQPNIYMKLSMILMIK